MSELREIRRVFQGLQTLYEIHIPKADPSLISDLLVREQENPKVAPMYTVEVFTKEGIDPEASRSHIMKTTGMATAIYDKGTHYVTHMRLTPEILKKLNDFEHVLEIMGDYTGTDASTGPRHNLGDFRKRYQDDSRQKNIS